MPVERSQPSNPKDGVDLIPTTAGSKLKKKKKKSATERMVSDLAKKERSTTSSNFHPPSPRRGSAFKATTATVIPDKGGPANGRSTEACVENAGALSPLFNSTPLIPLVYGIFSNTSEFFAATNVTPSIVTATPAANVPSPLAELPVLAAASSMITGQPKTSRIQCVTKITSQVMASPLQGQLSDTEKLQLVVMEGERKSRPYGPANLGYMKLPSGETVNADNTCVLVVHYGFENAADPEDPLIRHGNEKEVKNLKKTFYEKRKCNFRDLPSPKKEVLLELLGDEEKLLRFFSLRKDQVPSVFILFILSHGNEGGIIYTDQDHSFTTAEVFHSLEKLSNFTDCLKFINFGPCRGSLDDHVNSNGKTEQKLDNLNSCSVTFSPNIHNLVVLYSTVETTKAIRENIKGTWLGQTTCQVLDFLSEDKSLELFLNTMQSKIHKRSCNHTDLAGNRLAGQTPEVKMFSLDGHFYFSALPKEHRALEIPSTSTDGRCAKDPENVNFLDEKYQWKSDTEENISACKAYIICNDVSRHVRQLDHIFDRNPSIESRLFQLNDQGIKDYFNKVSKPSPGVGCLMTFLFGKVVEQGPGKEVCLRVGTTELPIRDIIHKSIGPDNTHWVGKPKLFFILDQDEPLSSDFKPARNSFYIQATNHSSWLVLILKEKALVGKFIEIFKNVELQKEKCLQELLAALLLEEKAVGKILLNSTLQYKLQFPNWPRNFVKPDFHVYESRNDGCSLETFDKLLQKVLHSDTQVWLLSSMAGAGKTALFKEFAIEMVKLWKYVKCISSSLGNMNGYLMDNPKLSVDKFLAHASHRPEEELQKFFEAKRVVIFLDGFDDLKSENTEMVLRLLKELENKEITVLISTRPHEASTIQKAVRKAVKVEICPFDHKRQIELLQMLTKMSEMECSQFLDKFDGSQEILGNALHLTLIAQCERTENLYEIYDQVVKKMITRYLKEKKKLDMAEEENIKLKINEACNLHKQLAISYFKDKNVEFEGSAADSKKINECGFAIVDHKGHLEFANETFAEYFIVQLFREDSSKKNSPILPEILKSSIYKNCRPILDLSYAPSNEELRENLLKCFKSCPAEVLKIVLKENHRNIFEVLKQRITFQQSSAQSPEDDDDVSSSSWNAYVRKGNELLFYSIENKCEESATGLLNLNVFKDDVQFKRALPTLLKVMYDNNAVYIFREVKVKFPRLIIMINTIKPKKGFFFDLSSFNCMDSPSFEFKQILEQEGVRDSIIESLTTPTFWNFVRFHLINFFRK